MPNKPIIDIQVDDTQFKAFYELFEQFKGKLGEMPEEWKKLGEAGDESHTALAGATGALVESLLQASSHAETLAKHMQSATTAQKQFGSASHVGQTNLSKMAKDAKSLGESVFGIGKWLLKWGTIGGAAILGGTFFGLEKLANTAIGAQREGRGLGLTTGQVRAFDTDLGRYVDHGTLNAVADAQTDLLKRQWLARALDTNNNDVINDNAGSLAARLAIKAHDWWVNNPGNNDQQHFMATGFEQAGLSYEQVRRQGNTSREELVAAQSQYAKDSNNLNIGNGDTNSLYSFQRQLTLAGQALETAFTKKLSDLGPSLGSFITNLEKDAEVLLNGVLTPGNMKAIQDGIETFTKYIGSGEFKDDLKSFASGIASVAHAIAKAMHILDPDSTTDASTPGTNNTDDAEKNWLLDQKNRTKHPENFVYIPKKGGVFGDANSAPAPWDKATYAGPGFGYVNPLSPAYKNNKAIIDERSKSVGLPSGLIESLVRVESSGQAGAVSNKGARGLLQLMPSVVHDYGNLDPMNPENNLAMGIQLYGDLYKKNHGDLRKTLAAGNWGQGNLNKDINGYTDDKGVRHEGHGNDWERFAPEETRNHIARVFGNMARLGVDPSTISNAATLPKDSPNDAKDTSALAATATPPKPSPLTSNVIPITRASSKGAPAQANVLMPSVARSTDTPYFQALLDHFKQDRPAEQMKKALASLNWGGTKNVDRDVAAHGSDWQAYAPIDVQRKIQSALTAMAKNNAKPLNLSITNKSGTNVAVSTNAAAI